MTAHPIEDNAGCWWLTTRTSWERLHAVPGDTITQDDLDSAIDDGGPLVRTAACGRSLDLTYAGLFSRYEMPRCAHCCRAFGIPNGNGTPCNEQSAKQP